MPKTMTKEQTIERVLIRWKEWADANVGRLGRGYYGSGTLSEGYGGGYEIGFKVLERITEPRGEFERKLEMLDELLRSIPNDWSAEHRALLAGSIIRYMAELD